MIKCSFMDNQTVGADALNGIISSMVGSGIEDPFTNGVPYHISELNNVRYSCISDGVVLGTDLQVTVNGSVASVLPGKAFFANGMTAEVVSTEVISILKGIKCFVALCADARANSCTLICTEAEPVDNTKDGVYYVLLAEISENGGVTDRRKYAKGKLAHMYASDTGIATIVSFSLEFVEGQSQKTVDIETSVQANYMTAICTMKSGYTSFSTLNFETQEALSAHIPIVSKNRLHEGEVFKSDNSVLYIMNNSFTDDLKCKVTKTAKGFSFAFSGLNATIKKEIPLQFLVYLY